MTTYTFKLPKNNTNTSYNSYNNNYISELKSTIANNIASKYPWLDNSTSKTTYTVTYNKPSSTPLFDFSSFNFDSDYAKAINILDNYAAKKYNKKSLYFSDMIDEYDFEIDGIPVRIFDDMIQIGNHMIAKNASSYYYSSLNPIIKKTFINIIIKINK